MQHYRTLQHWNQWLTKPFLGTALARAEREVLTKLLVNHYGKHAVLIGVPHQMPLLQETHFSSPTLISPLHAHDLENHVIESDLHELPILSGSVDLVLLPHTLEFVENPRQLLAEACRIIKPEGLMVVMGFNPYSSWGLAKKMPTFNAVPWGRQFIASKHIQTWMRLADFQIESSQSFFVRPPVGDVNWFEKLHWMETLLHPFPFVGAVNVLIGRAKVIPLTPIRMKWKQQLSGLRLPSTISTPIARQNETFQE